MTPNKIIAIIPAFNEEKTIEKVIEGIKKYASEIVVVNDCSSDATEILAKNAGAIVVTHKENKGYDASIQDGFDEAVKRGADIFVTFDADGQHNPEDFKKLIDIIREGGADVAIGQRDQITHFGEKLLALYTSSCFGIKDPLCGLKAYSKKAYESVGHFDTIKSIGTQLTIEAVSRGFKLMVVPVTIKERKDSSRFYFGSIKANYKVLKALIRLILLKKEKV